MVHFTRCLFGKSLLIYDYYHIRYLFISYKLFFIFTLFLSIRRPGYHHNIRCLPTRKSSDVVSHSDAPRDCSYVLHICLKSPIPWQIFIFANLFAKSGARSLVAKHTRVYMNLCKFAGVPGVV